MKLFNNPLCQEQDPVLLRFITFSLIGMMTFMCAGFWTIIALLARDCAIFFMGF